MATTKVEFELDVGLAEGLHDWAAARGTRADDVIGDALASFLGAWSDCGYFYTRSM